MSYSRCVAVLSLLALLSACDKVDKLQQQVDHLTKVVDEAQKNATDVGVVSELGWVSKMLRDVATGTPDEQKKARTDAARLFSMKEADLDASQFFEVTVQLSAFEMKQGQDLSLDTKYFDKASADVAGQFFSDANTAGGGWIPFSIRSPDEYRRTESQIDALVMQRVTALFGEVTCGGQQQTGMFAGNFGKCEFGPRALAYSKPYFNTQEAAVKADVQKELQTRIRQLADVVMAPTEIAQLPPSGSRSGQRTVAWGLSGGAGTYLYVFVPQKQIVEHPAIKMAAWLHVKGFPEKILGPGIQIQAVDFAERCLGTIKYKENPTPPVDSRSSAGPLCWYVFDLFGAGARARLQEMVKEANLAKKS